MIVVKAGWAEIEAELDRLSGSPSPIGTAALETVFDGGAKTVQGAVHVLSGSLKSSGKSRSGTNRATHSWSGQIRYGGPSMGVNNPVDYAIYEKRRGGAHDFFLPLIALHEGYVQAILTEMRGA